MYCYKGFSERETALFVMKKKCIQGPVTFPFLPKGILKFSQRIGREKRPEIGKNLQTSYLLIRQFDLKLFVQKILVRGLDR